MNRARKRNPKKVISDINITPFVDVLLILLIIFMVTAPMMSNGFDVNLPKSSRNQLSSSTKNQQIVLSIDAKTNVYLDNKLIKQGSLKQTLQKYDRKTTQFFIKADKSVAYKHLIKAMSVLSTMGFVNISLVTEIK